MAIQSNPIMGSVTTFPKYTSGVSAALRGELPSDVTDLIKRQAAEFGVASGMPGSQFAGYRGLRQLGLTSLSEMQRAQQLLTPSHLAAQQQAYRMQDRWWDEAMRQQAEQRAANERAGQRWNAGGGTPPLVSTGGAPGGQPSRPGAPSNTQSLVQDILSKYGYGGGGAGPMNYSTGTTSESSIGTGEAPAPSNIYMRGPSAAPMPSYGVDPYGTQFNFMPEAASTTYSNPNSPLMMESIGPQGGSSWYDPFAE